MIRPGPKYMDAAITGLGVVSSVGTGADAFWKNLVAGVDGFGAITVFDASGHRTQRAAEVKDSPGYDPLRLNKAVLSRGDIFALDAARQALSQSNLLDADGCVQDSQRTALICATSAGGILGLETFFRHKFEGTEYDAADLLTSFTLSALATNIALEFGIAGYRTTVATVCSSSGLALAAGLDVLRRGQADRVLVVGAESLCQVTHAGFNSLRSIDPELCRPFDAARKGLVLGEGAGAIVLERPDTADAQPHRTLAYLAGYGLVTDVHHFTAPEPTGGAAATAMRLALGDAGRTSTDIDYLNAHGTGTPLNDAAEAHGVVALFGPEPAHLTISSSKSMLGHLLGAASIVEAVATVLTMNNSVCPPTAHLESPAPDLGLDLAPKAHSKPVRCALSNSFAFGGSDISVAFTDSLRDDASTGIPASGVAVTGIGVVSPYGMGGEALIHGVDSGKSGLNSLETVDSRFVSLCGGLVDMGPVRAAIPPARRRHLNRPAMFLHLAVREALDHADLTPDDLRDAAMAFGTAYGCSGSVHHFYNAILTDGPRNVLPPHFILSVTNAPAALEAQQLGLSGPVWVFVADECSFDACLAWGADMIRDGQADTVLVAAAEEISPAILDIHHALGFFDGENPLRLGEGAVCMVLENEDNARERGAPIIGRILAAAQQASSGCGPQEYAQDYGSLAQAAHSTLNGVDIAEKPLAIFGPDVPVLRNSLKTTSRANPRAMLGESGTASGLCLAYGLLSSRIAPGMILNCTSSRGGLMAASLVEKIG
ncbi:hypothetical protein DPQ33_02305 [Oceanidesulfovibrio indonesiensis]|uniref:Ketosynthase family 3 (KS3) domain-containing protein n=1 Tax=Oceanidesulfovibrio indonesiensis TaxID=54767 RepID=A0A7M3MHP6_9BACT|nr:beta-ketoacyl-[acyl-carrier-protein] synthase family protein [Oceanidesulfovibrio indonesiensis]TVM19213.1 hypothetical protein DPQ33_02305 [Oceanidesulfovibrio indonesiensis]